VSSPASLGRVLTALADPHRRRAVELLRKRPRRAGELADALGLSAPAMSKHLRELRKSGLVEETHPDFDARVRVYSLKAGAIEGLREWVDEMDLRWADELASFKAHVERGRGKGFKKRA